MASFISKTAALFAQLLEQGSISASSIDRGSSATQAQFARLSASGIISKQRRGSGNRYELRHPLKLQAFIDSEFPSGLLKPLEDTPNRTYGVLTQADSKTNGKLDFDLVMLRGTAELMINQESQRLTHSDHAFLSLKISENSLINIVQAKCRIVTVENPTVFTELNKIEDLQWDVAVYTAGKMSSILLDQLVQWSKQGHHLTHFGDFDYVGLLEYVRLLTRCSQAQLHTPTQLDNAFIERFGNVKLHEKQIKQHEILLAKIDLLPESNQKYSLLKIYNRLQNTGKGLEQEAFLIKLNSSV